MGVKTGWWRSVWLTCITCFGAFLFAYDTGIIGGLLTLKSFQEDFGFDKADKDKIAQISGLTASILQGGAFFGCILVFPVAVRFGRVPALIGASVVFMFGALLQTIPYHLAVFYVGRAVSGLAVGACTVLIPIFTAEMSPKGLRGRLGSFFQLFFAIGVCFSYWINYAASTTMAVNSHQWQMIILIQFVPALGIYFGMQTIPESCRWLAKRQRMDEARKSLRWVRGDSTGDLSQSELGEIMFGIREEGRITQGLHWREAFFKNNRYRLFVAFAMMLMQQLTGNTSLAYFAPQVFKAIAGGTTQTNIMLTGFFGVVKVFAVSMFILCFIDRIGRKSIFAIGGVAMGCCMVVLAVLVKLHPPSVDAASTVSEFSVYGRAAVGIVWAEAFCYNMSWGPLAWVYLGEIFPNRIREMGVATGAASQWAFNFTMSQITPYAIDHLGWKTFLMFAIFNFANAVISYFLVKETTNRSLEEMEIVFGPREVADTFESARRKFLRQEMIRSTRPEIPEPEFSIISFTLRDFPIGDEEAAAPQRAPTPSPPRTPEPPRNEERSRSPVVNMAHWDTDDSDVIEFCPPPPQYNPPGQVRYSQNHNESHQMDQFVAVPEGDSHGFRENQFVYSLNGFRYYQVRNPARNQARNPARNSVRNSVRSRPPPQIGDWFAGRPLPEGR